jgi:hypothetical protein
LLFLELMGRRQHVRHRLSSFCLMQPTLIVLQQCRSLQGLELAMPQIESVNDFSYKLVMNLEY